MIKDFFKNQTYSLISVLLLEGIYFYNFTTPEFNVNVCQLPFWALTIYYCWQSIKKDDVKSWILFGLFAALFLASITVARQCFTNRLFHHRRHGFGSAQVSFSFLVHAGRQMARSGLAMLYFSFGR